MCLFEHKPLNSFHLMYSSESLRKKISSISEWFLNSGQELKQWTPLNPGHLCFSLCVQFIFSAILVSREESHWRMSLVFIPSAKRSSRCPYRKKFMFVLLMTNYSGKYVIWSIQPNTCVGLFLYLCHELSSLSIRLFSGRHEETALPWCKCRVETHVLAVDGNVFSSIQ